MANISVENSKNNSENVTVSWQDGAMCKMGLTICPFGIVSAILIIFSLWSKVWSERKIFFILMIVIASLDLCFNCSYIFIRCAAPSYFNAVMHGFTFSFSLASDLCALALTIERYLILCWPQKMQNVSPRTANVTRAVAAIVISAISTVRLQYMVDDIEAISPFPANFNFYWQPIFVGLSIFGDMVLPFAMTISMSAFSAKIISVVVKKQRVRAQKLTNHGVSMVPAISAVAPRTAWASNVGQDPDNPPNAKKAVAKSPEDMSSVISLCLILDFFFIMNQIGYSIFAIYEINKSVCNECESAIAYEIIAFATDFTEVLSRSLHFYFYMKFSRLLRHEFSTSTSKIRNLFY